MIFDDFRPSFLPCLDNLTYNVHFWGVILDPPSLPTLKLDIINGRSLLYFSNSFSLFQPKVNKKAKKSSQIALLSSKIATESLMPYAVFCFDF